MQSSPVSINERISEKKTFQTRLTEVMKHLEARVQQILDTADMGQLNVQDGENFYSLLGAFRGVSDALVAYAASAGAIDWTPWREERF